MKTKNFVYEIKRGLWVVACARIVKEICLVNFCYMDSLEAVTREHVDMMASKIIDIQLWADENGCHFVMGA